jgi:NADPH:quinone reductase-like Zn-dependent oxidoreductase
VALPWLLGHQLHLQGCNAGPLAEHQALARAVAASRLQPAIETTWPFEALPEALAAAPRAEQFGKVVLQID